MGVIVDKIANLEFDELVTLNLIEKDSDLNSMFKEDINLPFSILYRMSKDGVLNEDIKKIIFEFFEKVILTKKNYIEKYQRILNAEDIIPQSIEEPIIAEANDKVPEILEKKSIIKIKKEKPLDEKNLPKWYGKQKILKDIESQGGKPTNKQTAALALNDLKNIFLNLNTRLISDMLLNTEKLTDEECRTIKSTIKILETKLTPIIKKR